MSADHRGGAIGARFSLAEARRAQELAQIMIRIPIHRNPTHSGEMLSEEIPMSKER